MSDRLHPLGVTLASLAAMLLAGCASQTFSLGGTSEPPPAQPTATLLPASIPAADLVGRWGLAAYHKDEDRARTEAAARGQCRQPYNIGRGPTGGVIMHLPDQAQPTELSLKGGADEPGAKPLRQGAGLQANAPKRQTQSFQEFAPVRPEATPPQSRR